MVTLSRLLLGTFVYLVIVVLASPFPTAAGLMLTFPALNGLGLFFTKQSSIGPMARSMLWMPLINGALCAGYIVVFLLLAKFGYPTPLAWLMLAIILGLWLAIVTRKRIEDGVADKHQLTYGAIATLVGLTLVAAAFCLLDRPASFQHIDASERAIGLMDFVGQAVWQNKVKIGLFAICLLIFLVVTKRVPVSDAARGILSGLPIVPFGGLVSVAGDSSIDRFRSLEGMAVSVWLGPAIAIWFVYGFSKYLDARQPHEKSRIDNLIRFGALVLSWLACGFAIAAVTYVLALFA